VAAAAESADASFTAIAGELLREPDVDEGTGFGTNPGLRVRGKIFAILVRGELVVKLPAERCEALVREGRTRYFEIGKRRMRERVSVEHGGDHEWDALAREALDFVRKNAPTIEPGG